MGDKAPAPAWRTPDVDIRRSKRRRKTVAVRWEGDRIVASVPATLGKKRARAAIAPLVEKLVAERAAQPGWSGDDALAERARELSETYLDGKAHPASVRWTSRQRVVWGSCSATTREIRISERLRAAPDWVLDAVIVHELAHLLAEGHGPEFQKLVAKYPRTTDSQLFLAGYALGLRAGGRRSS